MKIKLNDEVVQQLDKVNITQKERNQIARCISRYSAPKTFSEALSYVTYRIINAVKAVFGCSDWQLSSKIFIKTMKLDKDFKEEIFKELKVKGLKNKALTERINTKVVPLLYKLRDDTADITLQVFVLKNEGKADTDDLHAIFRKKMSSITKKLDKEIALIQQKYGVDLSSLK